MDRDKRWERVAKAYAAIVVGGRPARTRCDWRDSQVPRRGRQRTNSSFPASSANYAGVRDGDALLFANFRPDRAREISTALLDPDFDGFARTRLSKFCAAAGMTQYSEPLARLMTAIFPPQDVSETIGEVFAEHGLKQLRIAETEKYPHVTFFMNGGREMQFPGEERILVPSPKIATYDLKPEMSAYRSDRQACGSGSVRQIRPYHRQLCQSRHGRPYRRDGRGNQGGRGCGFLSWAACAKRWNSRAAF